MYEITYKHVATTEYAKAIEWYKDRSLSSALNFIQAVDEKLDIIGDTPQRYKNLYKNYREVSLRKYPYTIVYIIEKKLRRVVIVAIYHHKRDPKTKYRK